MPYDAITIDSNVVIRAGFKFETGLLAQLSQFKDGAIEFRLSDVVIREIAKHLTAENRKHRDTAIKAVSDVTANALLDDIGNAELDALIKKIGDPRDLARERIRRFGEVTGAKLVRSSAVTGDEVLKLYFDAKPPFEETGSKKSEFPDAFALLSLEKWAKAEGKRVLAVSGDRGWKAFAERSEHIDVIESLAEALEIVQKHTEQAEVAFAAFLDAMQSGDVEEEASYFEAKLSAAVSELDANGEADSHYYWELDYISLTMRSFELLKTGSTYNLAVVKMGADETVAIIQVGLAIEAEGNFSLSVKDGIDNDYIPMGSTTATAEIDENMYVLVTLTGDINGAVEDLSVSAVEVDGKLDTIDFGTIDIDHSDNDSSEWLDDQPGSSGESPYL